MKYPIVDFTAKMNKVTSIKLQGLLVNDTLIAGASDNTFESYTLYNPYGYKAVKLSFATLKDSVDFASLFLHLYADYLILWEDDAQAKIPELTQWTIENGLIVIDTIRSFDGRIITFDQFNEAYHARLGI